MKVTKLTHNIFYPLNPPKLLVDMGRDNKQTVACWVPCRTAERVAELVKGGEYVNVSDFLRQAIREKLERGK